MSGIRNGDLARARRRRCPTGFSPVASPTASTPRQRRLRRIQTSFKRATAMFVDVENRRLQLEEEREKNLHQREMERLRLESRRLDLEQEHQIRFSNRLEAILSTLTKILTEIRPLSRP